MEKFLIISYIVCAVSGFVGAIIWDRVTTKAFRKRMNVRA